MTEVTTHSAGFINLRGDPGDANFIAAATDVLRQQLPLDANKLSLGAQRIYWLGPDEWLIVTAAGDAGDVVARLGAALEQCHAAINDVSGGMVAFRAAGPDVLDVLAAGCSLDLDPGVFGVGDCAQTGLAKASVVIGRIDAASGYEIIVRRSFSEYLLLWLRRLIRYHADSASC